MAKAVKIVQVKSMKALLILLFLCSQSMQFPITSGATASFPLLPTDGFSYGGLIDIDRLTPEQISILAQEEKSESLVNQIGDSSSYAGNDRYIVKFGPKKAASFSGMNALVMQGVGKDAKPLLLLSENSVYLPKCDMVANKNSIGRINFYDLASEKLLFTTEEVNPTYIEDVSADKILVGFGNSYQLYDTKCWNSLLTCDSRHSWNDFVFASTEKIVCLDDSCKTIDISMFNIESKPVVDGKTVFFATPDKAGGKFFVLSAISCLGKLEYVLKAPFLYPMVGFEFCGVSGEFVLIKTGIWPKIRWTVFSMPMGLLKWEANQTADNPIECRFIGGNLVQKSKLGLVVCNLQKLREQKMFDFPDQAEFLTNGTKRFAVVAQFEATGKPTKAVYELSDDNQAVKSSKTIIEFASKGVYAFKDEFVAVAFEPVNNQDGFVVSNKYIFSYYTQKSEKSYKIKELEIPTECKVFPKTCIIDGRFFVQTNSAIEVYSLFDQMKKFELKLGGWLSTAVTPMFFVRGNRLFVDVPKDPDMDSSKQSLFCFDLPTGKLLLRQTLKDIARIIQVEQDYVLIKDSIDSDYTVLKVAGTQVQKKESLAILGNSLFFRKSEQAGEKSKTMLGKLNLNDGTQQFYETSCMLEAPSMILDRNIYSGCTGFVSEYGKHIQSPLGYYRLFESGNNRASIVDWSQERFSGDIFGQGGSNTIANLAPCPTFGLTRRSMNQFDLTMTRRDDLCGNLSGKVTAVFWPDDREIPPFVKLDSFSISIDNMKPDETTVINIDKNKISTVLGEKTGNMALIFDTNGLLDTLNSDSSVIGNGSTPQFEGSPIGIGARRALSIAVYRRRVN